MSPFASLPVGSNRPTWGAARRRLSERLASRFKIERGIPIPKARSHNGHKTRGISGVLRKLKRTESVFLPVHQGYANATASRIIGSGCYETRRERNGVRVWRVR